MGGLSIEWKDSTSRGSSKAPPGYEKKKQAQKRKYTMPLERQLGPRGKQEDKQNTNFTKREHENTQGIKKRLLNPS